MDLLKSKSPETVFLKAFEILMFIAVAWKKHGYELMSL